MSENKDRRLKLLDDLPAIAGGDKFHHEVYAGILREVLISNRFGMNVGLFGKWGSGKTTIVNLLCQMLSGKNYRTVIFNAWKARGDSIRRQLLLQVLKETGSRHYTDVARFVQPGIPLTLRPFDEQEKHSEKRVWWFLMTAEKLDFWVVSAILVGLAAVLGLVSLIINALLSGSNPNDLVLWAITALLGLCGSCMTIVYRWFQNRKEVLLTSAEPVSDSQRLKYPEQFQRLFEEEISETLGKDERLLIVVDDLDRCDAETVVEALSAIRQFSGSPMYVDRELRCQFLVPCDEGQIVLALEADGKGIRQDGVRFHDYRGELLRKFFDVIVRMDQFLPQKLSSYAEEVSGDIGLAPMLAREICGIANPRDPRQVKKLLNALKVVQTRVDISQQHDLLPKDLLQLNETLMALVALRETVPDVYDLIADNPAYLADSGKGLKERKSEGRLAEQIERAVRILERAGSLSTITAEMLITGQCDELLQGIPSARTFMTAFCDSDHKTFQEILEKADPDHRTRLLGWASTRIEQVSSESELRGMLALLIEYGTKSEPQRQQIMPCLERAVRSQRLLAGALDNAAYLDALATLMVNMADDARQKTYQVVLDNFEKDPKKRTQELRFLMHAPLLMRPHLQERFRNWTVSYVSSGSSESELQEIAERLAAALPKVGRHCWGYAPAAADVIIRQKWRDAERAKEPESWPHPRLVSFMVGNDADAAARCIQAVFAKDGSLHAQTQLVGQVGLHVVWLTVERLMQVVNPENAVGLYGHFKKWFEVQNTGEEVRTVLDALAPRLFDLSPLQISEVASSLSNWLINHPSDTWMIDRVSTRPGGEKQMPNWEKLTREFFRNCMGQLASVGGIAEWHRLLCKSAAASVWPIEAEADELLGKRLKNPQSFDEWLGLLQPLLGGKREATRTVVLDQLRRKNSVSEAIKTGVAVLWTEGFPDEDARALAQTLVSLSPNQLTPIATQLDAVLKTSNASLLIEIVVSQARDEISWLVEHSALLQFVASGLESSDTETVSSFDRFTKKLLMADDAGARVVGLRIQQKRAVLSKDINDEISRLAGDKNAEVAQTAKSLLQSKMTNQASTGQEPRKNE